jgi:hypothetical protein
MTTVKLDDTTAARFAGVTDLAEVTDAAGRVVGFFAPVEVADAAAYAEAAARAALFRKVLAEHPPRPSATTAEVLEHLKSLD